LVFFDRKRIEKVSGVDFVNRALEVCSKNGKRVFLLGASEANNALAVENIKKRCPGIAISGFSGSGNPSGFRDIKIKLDQFSPDFLVVGFSPPKQEKWVYEHFNELSCKVVIGAGGTIDFLSGNRKRAPLIMQKLGTEWFYRLIKEPKRIGRIFNAVVVFPCLLLLDSVRK
jgi:N-acetylglucosaminyldiphosphoundecaprenol N-acetyl-beta-D-mannosaminyltransferase